MQTQEKGLVEMYYEQNVVREKMTPFYVTNPTDEDFTTEWRIDGVGQNGEQLAVEYITVPANETMTFPAEVAFHLVKEMAKKMLYKANKGIKLIPRNWLPYAEKLIKPLSEKPVVEPKKDNAQAFREKIAELNSQPKETFMNKEDYIKALQEKGFTISAKNDPEAKTFSKASGIATLKQMYDNA